MAPVRCAYCHDTAGLAAEPCPACGTLLHQDCWWAVGACPTPGCETSVKVPDKPRKRLRVIPAVMGAVAALLTVGLGVTLAVWERTQEPIAVNSLSPFPDPPDPPASQPTSRPTDLASEPVDVTRIEISHAWVGQKYTFAMQNNMELVYQVTGITGAEITYTTTVIMNGKPLGNPTPASMPLKYAAGDTNNVKGPDPTGEETITVSGVSFECKIYEAAGSKSWSSTKFPCILKSESGGSLTLELVRIE